MLPRTASRAYIEVDDLRQSKPVAKRAFYKPSRRTRLHETTPSDRRRLSHAYELIAPCRRHPRALRSRLPGYQLPADYLYQLPEGGRPAFRARWRCRPAPPTHPTRRRRGRSCAAKRAWARCDRVGRERLGWQRCAAMCGRAPWAMCAVRGCVIKGRSAETSLLRSRRLWAEPGGTASCVSTFCRCSCSAAEMFVTEMFVTICSTEKTVLAAL